MTNSVKVELNMPKIIGKFQNNQMGLLISQEWKRLINPFTPHRTGTLEQTAIVRPFEIEYIQPYSRYIYYGDKYIDPVYQVGGFTKDGSEWWSRAGVSKVASGEPLNYRTDANPYACARWDVAAEQAGQKAKLTSAINKKLLTL